MNDIELAKIAVEYMKRSYSPYSGYTVGAALLCDDGSVFGGCNVENASYGATNCAERTAIFKAVSEGKRKFSAIAIVGGKGGYIREVCPPCGVCRQVISEFVSEDFRVILYDGKETVSLPLGSLLPYGFSKENIK